MHPTWSLSESEELQFVKLPSQPKSQLFMDMNTTSESLLVTRLKRRYVKYLTLKLLTFLMTIFCLFTQVNAQTNVGTANTFNQLDDSISKNQTKYDSGSEEGILRDIRASYDFLSSKWLGGSKKELSKEYLTTLDSNTELLLQTLNIPERMERLNILQAVKRDLKIKVRAARKGANAAETFNVAINVTVRTFKNNSEVSGYLVRCNPQLYANNKTPLFPFNNETSPSTRSLPPGYYVLWIEDKNNQKIVTRQISIGDDNLVDIEIKVSIP